MDVEHQRLRAVLEPAAGPPVSIFHEGRLEEGVARAIENDAQGRELFPPRADAVE